MPTAEAGPAPHRSSTPSSVNTAPFCVTASVNTLQYGCSCHVNVPRGCAAAGIDVTTKRNTASEISNRGIVRYSRGELLS